MNTGSGWVHPSAPWTSLPSGGEDLEENQSRANIAGALGRDPFCPGLWLKLTDAMIHRTCSLCSVPSLTGFSVCMCFSFPSGLFITIHDKGHLATMLNSWPEDNIKVWPCFL